MQSLQQRAQNIKCLICDVDGVLTDGYVYMSEDGQDYKAFHYHDGVGLKLLMLSGIEIAIITTSVNKSIDRRIQQLGINHYYTGHVNKLNPYQALKQQLQLDDQQIAYIGDDLPDLPIIEQVGLGVAVNNAIKQVAQGAHYVTQHAGGHGAVREVCDLIMESQNTLPIALDRLMNRDR